MLIFMKSKIKGEVYFFVVNHIFIFWQKTAINHAFSDFETCKYVKKGEKCQNCFSKMSPNKISLRFVTFLLYFWQIFFIWIWNEVKFYDKNFAFNINITDHADVWSKVLLWLYKFWFQSLSKLFLYFSVILLYSI